MLDNKLLTAEVVLTPRQLKSNGTYCRKMERFETCHFRQFRSLFGEVVFRIVLRLEEHEILPFKNAVTSNQL